MIYAPGRRYFLLNTMRIDPFKLLMLAFVILLPIANSLRILSGPRIVLSNSYQLTCEGGVGEISYDATNLPKGVAIKDDEIYISNQQLANNGNYYIKLQATDSDGESSSKMITLTINIPKPVNKKIQIQRNSNPTPQNIRKEIAVDPSLVQFLNSLQIPDNPQSTGEAQRYELPNLPQGSNLQPIDYEVRQIMSRQNTPSLKNRNTITQEEIEKNIIFERQLNAAKALSNIFTLIQQAKANAKYANQEAKKMQQKLIQARDSENQLLATLSQIGLNLDKAKNAINNLSQNIKELQQTKNQLEGQLAGKTLEKQSLEEIMRNLDDELNRLNSTKKKNSYELQTLKSNLKTQKDICQALQEQFSSTIDRLREKIIQRGHLNSDIINAEEKVVKDKKRIEELKKQLADAQNQLKTDEGKVSQLNQKMMKYDSDIKRLRNIQQNLSTRREDCYKGIERMEGELDKLNNKIADLDRKRTEIEKEVTRLNQLLSQILQQLERLPTDIGSTGRSISDNEARLQYLRSETLKLQNTHRKATIAAEQAEALRKGAEQDYSNVLKQVQAQEKIISDATLNLQRARIQKQSADLAVEQYLKRGVDILPFPAAPSSLSSAYNQQTGTYRIDSWDRFVRNTFGSEIKPTFTGDLETLYQFKVETSEDGQCSNQQNISIMGFVISIDGNTISLIDNTNGEITKVKFVDCTLSLSNFENYNIKVGDLIIVKGVQEKGNSIEATEVVCVRR